MSKDMDKFRTMTEDELKGELVIMRTEYAIAELSFRGTSNTRGSTPVGQYAGIGMHGGNTMALYNLHKGIARVLTELRQRELERETASRIRKVLKAEGYGLLAHQIKKRAGLELPPPMVGLVCAHMPDVERVNSPNPQGKGRWRLRR